jgi:hypothetical protein
VNSVSSVVILLFLCGLTVSFFGGHRTSSAWGTI